MSPRTAIKRRLLKALMVSVVAAVFCGQTAPDLGLLEYPSPASSGALAPSWVVGASTPTLVWLEPAPGGGHTLRLATLSAGKWQLLTPPVSGDRFFANWADMPAVAQAPDGSLVAHWLEKNGSDTYAYGIELARSTDAGRSWARIGRLHDDPTPAEHGFVSWVPEGKGLRAFWLDGRDVPKGGAMSLRTASVGASVSAPELLDPRVCDCCQTGAAASSLGPLVVYRDRSEGEIRDTALVRRAASGWSPPQPVGNDGWKIPGCPVNGPQIAARENRVAVAWFTGAGGGRVRLAFSADGGASFATPLELGSEPSLGRVSLLLDADGNALLSWMATVKDQAEIRLQRLAPSGKRSPPLSLGRSTAGRASGFPRLTLAGDRLLAVWVEAGAAKAGASLRIVEIPLSRLPLS